MSDKTSIDLGAPSNLEQINAIADFQRAVFAIGKAYGLQKPAKLLDELGGYNLKWKLEDLLEGQDKILEVEAAKDLPEGGPVAAYRNDGVSFAKKDVPEIEDIGPEPINLDDIVF